MNITSNSQASYLLLRALLAVPVQLQLVAADDKIMAFRDSLLQILDRFIFKFGNRTATGADQMVVMLALHQVFIAGLPVPEMDLMGDPRLGKKFQSPGHRCITDARMPGSKLSVQFLHAHVPFGGKEKIENDVALSSGSQPLPGNELAEGFLL
jgi:hypothetical protein